ncbi:predicted protein [Sclerotinia sclerotiorum 1980 UF-70]|uniref:Uncharacterized protein n=1 Tax=Sclerotinia sclerotiorum (strain ATCC 18683 / 1980 / Ss-1) TaxID=665079 RepID=A7EB93_SCLS1|nr:predicted protein [Sclerotinia sclerotiorum 1980 UF-70]EDN99721.1 predicted protein [Sclerotinia sclerotiorum 1980 UF-70]
MAHEATTMHRTVATDLTEIDYNNWLMMGIHTSSDWRKIPFPDLFNDEDPAHLKKVLLDEDDDPIDLARTGCHVLSGIILCARKINIK